MLARILFNGAFVSSIATFIISMGYNIYVGLITENGFLETLAYSFERSVWNAIYMFILWMGITFVIGLIKGAGTVIEW